MLQQIAEVTITLTKQNEKLHKSVMHKSSKSTPVLALRGLNDLPDRTSGWHQAQVWRVPLHFFFRLQFNGGKAFVLLLLDKDQGGFPHDPNSQLLGVGQTLNSITHLCISFALARVNCVSMCLSLALKYMVHSPSCSALQASHCTILTQLVISAQKPHLFITLASPLLQPRKRHVSCTGYPVEHTGSTAHSRPCMQMSHYLGRPKVRWGSGK